MTARTAVRAVTFYLYIAAPHLLHRCLPFSSSLCRCHDPATHTIPRYLCARVGRKAQPARRTGPGFEASWRGVGARLRHGRALPARPSKYAEPLWKNGKYPAQPQPCRAQIREGRGLPGERKLRAPGAKGVFLVLDSC